MRKSIFLVFVLLFCQVASNAQLMRETKKTLNIKSYPAIPLAYNTIYLNCINLHNAEQYGITKKVIDSIFSANPSIKIVPKNEAAYVLTLTFYVPSFTNKGITTFKKMDMILYKGVADCDFPMKASLFTTSGNEILPETIVSKMVTLEGEASSSAATAKSNFETRLLNNKNKRLAEIGINNLNSYRNSFLNNHYVSCLPYEFNWSSLKSSKKFPNKGYEKCTSIIDSLSKIMKSNESLFDYPNETAEMINFFNQELKTFDPMKKSNWKRSNTCSFNLLQLYTLNENFDSLPSIYPYIENFKIVRFMVRDNKVQVEKTLENKKKYMSGYRIDESFIQQAQIVNTKDSLKTKPSKVRVYMQDNTSFDLTAILFHLRPGFVIESNIIDLSYGEVLPLVNPSTYERTTSIKAKDIKKVTAGNEVYYPLKFGTNLSTKLVYVHFENEKAFLASFKDNLILQRKDIEDNLTINTISQVGLKKRVIEYFNENTKVKTYIENKKGILFTHEDLVEVVKLYGE